MHTGDLLWLAIAGTLVVLLGLYLFFRRTRCCKCSREAHLTTLLILVHNQQEIIEGVMRSIANLYHQGPLNIEIIVVDQQSTDQTLAILRRVHRGWEGFILLSCESIDLKDLPVQFIQHYVHSPRLCCLQLNRPISSDAVIRTIEGLLRGGPEVDEEIARVYYILRPEGSGGP